jgi:septal ring factor EnvC (AmiA/AmiB activator)
MSGFDYAWTCPKIDKEIAGAQYTIHEFVFSLISEFCPKIPQEALLILSNENSEALYSDLEGCFEEARKSNEDMRKAAEKQISNLEDELEEEKQEVKRLQLTVAELEEELESLRANQIS